MPILDLNCRLQFWLQKEHVNSDSAGSDGGSLALPFSSLRFYSASQTLFDSNCAASLLVSQHHFVRSCAACSQDSAGILKSLSEALRVSL